MVSPLPQQTAFAVRLAPGETADFVWRIDNAPADAALVGTASGGDGGLTLLSLHTFRQVVVPYSEEELREFPAAMRDRLRKEGKIELVDDGTVGPGAPLAVTFGGSVEARFAVAAGAAKGRIIRGAIRLAGPQWGELTADVVAVVASGGLRVAYQPEQMRMLVAPGTSSQGSVVVPPPAVAARAVAVLDSPSGGVVIQSVRAMRTDVVPATPDELAELPPGLRDKIAQTGWEVLTEVASVGAGEPVDVPAGGSLQVGVEATAPDGPPQVMDAVLTIVSDRWDTIRVPVRPITTAVEVALDADRLVVEQGGDPATTTLTVRARGYPPSLVELTLGDADDPWRLEPRRTSVPAGGERREVLAISAAAHAPLGPQPASLFVHWFDGLGSTTLPLTLEVRPGRVGVLALTPQIAAPQGGTATATVRVTAAAGTTVRFRPAYLPRGVDMLPVPQAGFAPGAHDVQLAFRVDPHALARPGQRIAVVWEAADGVQSGVLELRLAVALVPAERRFERPVITPPGMALGGRVAFALTNDGGGRFSGHMRATGAPSFRFRLLAMLRSADGAIGLLEEEQGDVHGTFDFGSREHRWDRPLQHGVPAELWPRLATAELTVARGTELAGIFGAVVDRLRDLVDTVAGLGVLVPLVPGGHALVALVVASNDLRELTGVRVVGPGGVVGLLAAAGGAFLVGPGAIIPVFVGAGAATALASRQRAASAAERAFAAVVFRDTLPWDRILLTNLAGANGRPFVCPNVDGQILLNLGGHLFDAPAERKGLDRNGQEKREVNGQTFIHELVHAWQIAHGPFDAGFLARGITEQLLEGDHAYHYGPAGPPFADFGLEGGAALIDAWFGRYQSATDATFDTVNSEADPYFRYVAGNIRLAVP